MRTWYVRDTHKYVRTYNGHGYPYNVGTGARLCEKKHYRANNMNTTIGMCVRTPPPPLTPTTTILGSISTSSMAKE